MAQSCYNPSASPSPLTSTHSPPPPPPPGPATVRQHERLQVSASTLCCPTSEDLQVRDKPTNQATILSVQLFQDGMAGFHIVTTTAF